MSIKKTDIKRYYNSLVDERHLKPATIDSIHTVLHQVFEMAVHRSLRSLEHDAQGAELLSAEVRRIVQVSADFVRLKHQAKDYAE